MAKKSLPTQSAKEANVHMLGNAVRDIAGEGLRPDDQVLSEENGRIKYRAVKQNDEAVDSYRPTPTENRAFAHELGGKEIELLLYRAIKSPHLIQGPRRRMLLGELQAWAFEGKKTKRLAPHTAKRGFIFDPKTHSISSLSLYRQIKKTNPRLEQLLGFRQLRPSRNYNAVRTTQIAADGYDQVETEGVLKGEQVNKVADYAAAVQPMAPLFTPTKRRLRDNNSLKLENAILSEQAPDASQGRKTVDLELLLLAAHAARFPVPFAA